LQLTNIYNFTIIRKQYETEKEREEGEERKTVFIKLSA
jgi:hypothetical protein